MTLIKIAECILVDDAIKNTMKDFDAIIFDCDGVLIDITKSYDLAIQKTTEYILKEFGNITDSIKIDSQIIDGFKATGGFNDEVDLTYAAIISLATSKKLNNSQKDFIFKVIKNANSTGIISVEKYLEKIGADISELKNKLNYPGNDHQNPLYSIFDQMFYGPELYSKLFNKKSKF